MLLSTFDTRFKRLCGRLAPGVAGACLIASSPGCADPLRQDAITALGDEAAGIPEGPLHRAGQPCLLCHDGTEATALAVAGTVYKLADSTEPAAGALVRLLDATGATHVAAANCAGNFFVRPGDFSPTYPMWVKIELAGWEQIMESPVGREGSCSACHTSSPSPSSAGRVYLLPFETDLDPQAEAGCR